MGCCVENKKKEKEGGGGGEASMKIGSWGMIRKIEIKGGGD